MLQSLPNSKEIFELDNPARYATTYTLDAIVSVVIDWMDDGMKISPRDLAEFFARNYFDGVYKTKQFYGHTAK